MSEADGHVVEASRDKLFASGEAMSHLYHLTEGELEMRLENKIAWFRKK